MDQIIVLEYDMHNLLERHTKEGTKCTNFADPMRIAIKKPLVSHAHVTKHLKNSKI